MHTGNRHKHIMYCGVLWGTPKLWKTRVVFHSKSTTTNSAHRPSTYSSSKSRGKLPTPLRTVPVIGYTEYKTYLLLVPQQLHDSSDVLWSVLELLPR